MKNKKLFYILQFTWGLPLNLIGFLVALILIILGKKPKKHKWCYYFEIGKNWGGFELGLFFLVDKNPTESIKNHELGHAIQNCWWGPLFLIVIWIPSMIRYQYRNIIKKIKPHKKLKPYNSIWFEGEATKLGESV